MAEKVKMIKQLKFYVDTYKKEKKYSNGEIKFCDLFHSGVQVGGVCNIFKIAKYLDVDVKINDWNHKLWTKEVSVMYEGVNFFTLGTEGEVANGGKENE